MNLDKLQVFLELTSYVNDLTSLERRVASTIEIKPTDSRFDFAMKISNKLQELSNAHSLSPVVSDPSPVPSPSQTFTVDRISSQLLPSSRRSAFSCTYYRKDGRNNSHCFLLKKKTQVCSLIASTLA